MGTESGLREDLRRAEALRASEMAAEEARINVETPVRLLKAAREKEVLQADAAIQELRNQVASFQVEHDLIRPRAEQEMRQQILPLEQRPRIIEAAAQVFQGTNLSLYGDHADLVGQLAPLFEIVGRAVRDGAAEGTGGG